MLNLRRKRPPLYGVVYLAFGVWMLIQAIGAGSGGRVALLPVAGLCLWLGGATLVRALRLFRFEASISGLVVRANGLDRAIRWSEVDSLVLAPGATAPRLLLVPAPSAGPDLAPTMTSPVDGRPARLLLEFDKIRESPDQVAEGLARCAGSRFVDARTLRGAAIGGQPFSRPDFRPEFTVVLRGYSIVDVDRMIQRGQEALASGNPVRMAEARAGIERDRGSLFLSLRGYQQGEVDALLDELVAELARPPAPDFRRPADQPPGYPA